MDSGAVYSVGHDGWKTAFHVFLPNESKIPNITPHANNCTGLRVNLISVNCNRARTRSAYFELWKMRTLEVENRGKREKKHSQLLKLSVVLRNEMIPYSFIGCAFWQKRCWTYLCRDNKEMEPICIDCSNDAELFCSQAFLF